MPLLQGTGNDDLWLWGLAQNDALLACNERLNKARELQSGP
nr:hypothetical protein [Halomonas xianhensis]